jgi:hypothetical protein
MVKRPNVSPLNHIKSYRIPSDVWLSVQEASAMVEALAEASPGPPRAGGFFQRSSTEEAPSVWLSTLKINCYGVNNG